MIRYLIVFIFIFALSDFAFSYTERDSVELGSLFLEGVKNKDFEKIKELLPPADIIRKYFNEDVKEMSDEDLSKLIVDNPKLKADFDNIMESAEEENINMEKLELNEVKIIDVYGNGQPPFGMSILYIYDGKDGEITISVLENEGSWYLLEILISNDIFSEVK